MRRFPQGGTGGGRVALRADRDPAAERTAAAAITAALVGYAITDHIESPGLKMGVVGATGYAAPECLDYLMRYIKSKGDAEVGLAKKPHGKSKAPAKGKRKR